MPSARSSVARLVNRVLRPAGVEVRKIGEEPPPVPNRFTDVEPWVAEIIAKVRPFTMTSDERISALCHAVRYVARSGIPGDIVECGVWRGGSMMAAALTLLAEGDLRSLHLYDTFEGMTAPKSIDRAVDSGKPAAMYLQEGDNASNLCVPQEVVLNNLIATGYPVSSIHLIKGKVEDTIPNEAPNSISLLRLDTDWYDSTKHELNHLYPRLTTGGVLIIDDYGYWEGARKATDEYVEESALPILLLRIDETGRVAIKLPSQFSYSAADTAIEAVG